MRALSDLNYFSQRKAGGIPVTHRKSPSISVPRQANRYFTKLVREKLEISHRVIILIVGMKEKCRNEMITLLDGKTNESIVLFGNIYVSVMWAAIHHFGYPSRYKCN
jgi:hypothetical protein